MLILLNSANGMPTAILIRMRMTLENESLTFTQQGVYVQPLLSDGFWFNGSATELLSILVFHTEIDIDRAIFRVRISQWKTEDGAE